MSQSQDNTNQQLNEKSMNVDRDINANALSSSIPAKTSLNEKLNEMIHLFSEGNLDACELMALEVTAEYPDNGVGWKVLGVVYQNQMINDKAIYALKHACELMPEDSEAHYNLANCHFDLEDYDDAIKHYEKAIAIDPVFIKAYFNLGSIYKEQMQHALAENYLKQVITLDPENIEAHLKLAQVYDAQLNYESAIALLQNIIVLGVSSADIYLSLAIIFDKSNQKDEARVAYVKALGLDPDNRELQIKYANYLISVGECASGEDILLESLNSEPYCPESLNSLGVYYLNTERFSDAEYYLKLSMIKNPDNVLAYINYGLLKLNTGAVQDAGAYCMKALEICPDHVVAMNNLGLSLNASGNYADAVEQFEKIIAINPDYVPALSNLSTPLKRLGRLTEAATYLKHALELTPDSHDVHLNLAAIYQGTGDIEKAVELNLKAIELNPDKTMAYSNLLYDLCYSSDYSDEYVLAQLKRFGSTVTRLAEHPFTQWADKENGDILRIGFVSADFVLHPVTSFLTTVLSSFDKTQFELTAYTNNPRTDAVTEQIKPYFDNWKSIVGVSDAKAAKLIHDDEIDILIDLSGHTAGNRLEMFAYKPAPVQVTWLGYWASTGVEEIDYIIVDEMSAPRDKQSQFTEQAYYVPDTRFCYSPPVEQVAVSDLPAIANGYVTVGCYHNYAKVTDEVLVLWADVLKQVPTAQLRWQTTAFKDPFIIDEVRNKLVSLGIDATRLQLLPSVTRIEYLHSFSELDFILDSFPFTACTTTSDGLWMGVPTLTIAGETMVARQSTSLMSVAKLPEWIAQDKAGFVAKAVQFANDIPYLKNTREALRGNVSDSALGNPEVFTRNIERALLDMWDTYTHAINTSTALVALPQIQTTKVNIISATRMTESDFWTKSALGQSLKAMSGTKQAAHIANISISFENTQSLSAVYNKQIDAVEDDAQILVFMHDDIWIDDAHFVKSINAGLLDYDVIGVAGNTRRVPNQPAWAMIDGNFTWDTRSNLTGKVRHGETAFGTLAEFGRVPQACELLDGMFLAVKKKSLVENHVYFDEQFDFHFYDMDFCRSARHSGLTLGTWDIPLTHQSGGNFGGEQWHRNYKKYLNKWELSQNEGNNMNTHNELVTENDAAIHAVIENAKIAILANDFNRAQSSYKEALQLHPKNPVLNHEYGMLLFTQDDIDGAILHLEAAVMNAPNEERYWVSFIQATSTISELKDVLEAINIGLKHGLTQEMANKLTDSFAQGVNVASSKTKQTPVHDHHNPDLLEMMPINVRKVLEVGCSSGALAREYKQKSPSTYYIGADIDDTYIDLAKRFCDETLVGDIEEAGDEFWAQHKDIDCWVFGDALEHLKDPWALLRKVHSVMPKDGVIVACIPNAQHWSVQVKLNIGDFRYEDSGLFDRTHLRWFTKQTMFDLFNDNGFSVSDMKPRIFNEPGRETFLPVIENMAKVAGVDTVSAVEDAKPLQYVFKAVMT